jgi:hypothetical protein
MLKKLQTMLRAIDPARGFNDEHDAGIAMSSVQGEGGLQQRHAANPRPARLRGPWRAARSRRPRIAPR